MIKSFKDKETEKIFNRYFSKKLPQSIQRSALLQLRSLNQAKNINDLRNPPSNHLEKLGGDRKGQLSIKINDQWRICFVWDDNDAYEVEIADYH
jgi:proteic killer suppression protein